MTSGDCRTVFAGAHTAPQSAYKAVQQEGPPGGVELSFETVLRLKNMSVFKCIFVMFNKIGFLISDYGVGGGNYPSPPTHLCICHCSQNRTSLGFFITIFLKVYCNG